MIHILTHVIHIPLRLILPIFLIGYTIHHTAKLQKEHAAGRDSSHPAVTKQQVKLDNAAKFLYDTQSEIYSHFDEFEEARGKTMLHSEFTSFLACFYHQGNTSNK